MEEGFNHFTKKSFISFEHEKISMKHKIEMRTMFNVCLIKENYRYLNLKSTLTRSSAIQNYQAPSTQYLLINSN